MVVNKKRKKNHPPAVMVEFPTLHHKETPKLNGKGNLSLQLVEKYMTVGSNRIKILLVVLSLKK